MRYAGTAQYRAEYLSWTQPGQEWYAHMSATIFHVLSANFQCLSGARKGERGKDNAEARGTLRDAEVEGRGVWSGEIWRRRVGATNEGGKFRDRRWQRVHRRVHRGHRGHRG